MIGLLIGIECYHVGVENGELKKILCLMSI